MGVDCYIVSRTVRDQVKGGPCEANGHNAYVRASGQEVGLDPTRRADDADGVERYIINKATFDAEPAFASAQPYVAGSPVLNSSHPDFPPPLPPADDEES